MWLRDMLDAMAAHPWAAIFFAVWTVALANAIAIGLGGFRGQRK